MIDLGPAAREIVRLLDGVGDDLTGPTPCPGYSVAALLDHIMGLSLAFAWGARKTPHEEREGDVSAPGKATAEHLDPRWREVLPGRLTALAEAWREPGAWEGMTEVAGVTMPGEMMGIVALDEVVLHGWDLARATGQSFTCDPASTEAVLAFTAATAQPDQAAGREGLFGPVIEIPGDAPAFDRLLGFAGRDPGWRPAQAA
ncbi:TIGR03086 family metal-binding protein [Sphaerisporangium aureirubrum]|uniref:TIGR03086 family metal-binding protein n=1 Tax=Sphaerisporangium aureirubrum TaxID=1544736 RepID=A0ABW1NL64_9ACTN